MGRTKHLDVRMVLIYTSYLTKTESLSVKLPEVTVFSHVNEDFFYIKHKTIEYK